MKFRLSILNTLLIVGAVAAWTAVWVQSREIARFENQIPGLQNAARELVIEDPDQLTTVRPHPQWYGEESWLINVPESRKYQLNMVVDAIRGVVNSKRQNREPEHQIKLAPGNHGIEYKDSKLESGKWLLEVIVDDQVVFSIDRPSDWKPQSHSSSSHTDVGECKTHSDPICTLIQRKIKPARMKKTPEKSNGVHLWIEKE